VGKILVTPINALKNSETLKKYKNFIHYSSFPAFANNPPLTGSSGIKFCLSSCLTSSHSAVLDDLGERWLFHNQCLVS